MNVETGSFRFDKLPQTFACPVEQLASPWAQNEPLAPSPRAPQNLATQSDLHALLSEVLSTAVAIVRAGAGSLLLVDDKRKELEFSVVHGGGGESLVGQRMPLTKGIAGWVVQHKKPLIVNNPTHDPRFYAEIGSQFGYTSSALICVPMIVNDKVIGVLEALNRRDGSNFSEHDLSPLAAFADQATMSIQRKRAEEALRREREFVSSLFDTAPVIMLVLHSDGKIIRYNPYLQELSGFSLEEVRGQDWFTVFVPATERESLREALFERINASQANTEIGSIITKDGVTRAIEWSMCSRYPT